MTNLKFCFYTSKQMFGEQAAAAKVSERMAKHGKLVTIFWCKKCHSYHLANKKREKPP